MCVKLNLCFLMWWGILNRPIHIPMLVFGDVLPKPKAFNYDPDTLIGTGFPTHRHR